MKSALFALCRFFLQLVLLSAVLLGSCAGFGIAHHESPRFLKKAITDADARKRNQFFVAFTARDESGTEEIRALPYRVLVEHPQPELKSFHIPSGEFSLESPASEGLVSVHSRIDGAGVQTTRIHVVGDTPWASISEYEVHGEDIHVKALGLATFWLLLAAGVVPLILVYLAQKPIRHFAERVFPRV